MKNPILCLSASSLLAINLTLHAQTLPPLRVDFNQTGGFAPSGWETYEADDRTADSFISQTYSALGGTISLTPLWGDDTVTPPVDGMTVILDGDQGAKRMIERTSTAPEPQDLYLDWIGLGANTPARTAANPLQLVLSGIPAGNWSLTSYHHDVNDQTGVMELTITDANGDSDPIEIDVSAGTQTPTVVIANFTANGADPVTFSFSNLNAANGNPAQSNDFVVINGFEIAADLDSDDDGIPDSYENANGLNPDVDDTLDDLDDDGLNNLAEYLGPDMVANTGDETNPQLPDTDGDSLTDAQEINTTMTDPNLFDSDGDNFGDAWEVLVGSDASSGTDTPDNDNDGWSKGRTGEDDDNELIFPTAATNQLFVDFNSNQNGGGDSNAPGDPSQSNAVFNMPGYSSYHANQEVGTEFTAATYQAFGTSVQLTPSWPATPDTDTVKQSITRLGANIVQWQGDQRNLLLDWLGVDTRTTQGGLGNYDRTSGDPTPLVLTLSGLPADTYTWRSYHHDSENVHTRFIVEVSIDGGSNFILVETASGGQEFRMTSSAPGGTPVAETLFLGAADGYFDPAELPSTVDATFTADGTNDVQMRFTPLAETAVHTQFFGINGFELTGATIPTPPSSISVNEVFFDDMGQVVINFLGQPNTTYSVTASPDLTTGSFNELTPTLTAMTGTSGLGTAIIPATEASTASRFYRLERQ